MEGLYNMFENAYRLQEIPAFDLTKITDMSNLFRDVGATLPVETKEYIEEDFAIQYEDDLKLKDKIKRFFKRNEVQIL